MITLYIQVVALIERIHRHFLGVVKIELDALGIYDINNVQALMLFNLGNEEMTISDLMLHGCYLGSNVSYNVKKMAENGYIEQQRSERDRRAIYVRLTERGHLLRARLTEMHQRHFKMLLARAAMSDSDFDSLIANLSNLEEFWITTGSAGRLSRPGGINHAGFAGDFER
jgi:DNA-binding MarR family transcriptional regulator